MTRRSLDTLIPLVRETIAGLEVRGADDARRLADLEHCLAELQAMAGLVPPARPRLVPFPPRNRAAAR